MLKVELRKRTISTLLALTLLLGCFYSGQGGSASAAVPSGGTSQPQSAVEVPEQLSYIETDALYEVPFTGDADGEVIAVDPNAVKPEAEEKTPEPDPAPSEEKPETKPTEPSATEVPPATEPTTPNTTEEKPATEPDAPEETPAEPTKPSEETPAQPTEPSTPEQTPTETTEPSTPEQTPAAEPTQPSVPEQTHAEPTQPSEEPSEQPTQPSEEPPAEPTEPSEAPPTEPTQPEETPAQPTEPSQETPTQPSTPDDTTPPKSDDLKVQADGSFIEDGTPTEGNDPEEDDDTSETIPISSNHVIAVTNYASLVNAALWTQENDTTGYTVTITSDYALTVEPDFPGFGSALYPFRGRLMLDRNPVDMNIKGNALFNYLSTDAELMPIGSKALRLNLCDGRGGLAQVLVAEAEPASGNNPELTLSERLTIRIGTGYSGIVNTYSSGAGTSNAGALFGRITVDSTSGITIPSGITINVQATLSALGNLSVETTNFGDAGALIGRVDLPLTLYLDTNTAMNIYGAQISAQKKGNAGLLIGSIGAGAATTIYLPSSFAPTSAAKISARGGGAGMLVGATESALTVNPASGVMALSMNGTVEAITVNSYAGYAGSLVGLIGTSGSFSFTTTASVTASGSVSAGEAAGGLFGRVNCGTPSLGAITVSNTAVLQSDKYVGGYIGYFSPGVGTSISMPGGTVLISASIFPLNEKNQAKGAGGLLGGVHTAASQTITVDSSAVTFAHTFDLSKMTEKDKSTLGIGGVIGCASAEALTGALVLTGGAEAIASTVSGSTSKIGALGGLIGVLDENAYCQLTGASISMDANTVSIASNAAVAGKLKNGAVLNVTGAVSYTHTNSNGRSVMVGSTGKGSALRLSAAVIDTSTKFGNIVRQQDASLLYAESGFSFTYPNTIEGDDVGNYGQIIRDDILNIITFNSVAHTSTISSALQMNANTITLSSAADFAKLAITLCTDGYFSGVDTITRPAGAAALYAKNISITADIDLTGKGIEQLTRSDAVTPAYTGQITGTNGAAVTLDIGARTNGTRANSVPLTVNDKSLYNNVGSNSHAYLGMLSAMNNAGVHDLTVNGTIRLRGDNSKQVYAGGFAGMANGTASITGCTTAVEIYEGKFVDEGEDSRYGGFIGKFDGSSLIMTGSTSTAHLAIRSSAPSGGFIGHAKLSSSTANLSGNTISTTITGSESTTDARVGGLIALLEGADGGTTADLTGTATGTTPAPSIRVSADSTCGGLLGHTWSNITTTLNGSFSGTVTNSGAGRIGGLIYEMSGECGLMQSFQISGTYNSASASGDSDGLIVCQGKQLYLKVFCPVANVNSATIQRNGTTITANEDGRFDRLVGNNIRSWVDGVAVSGGIVSIETDDGNGKIPPAADGWYALPQNSKTRYYYNVDALRAITISGGSLQLNSTGSGANEKLLRWHLANYVGSAISAFSAATIPSTITAATDVDMRNMCLYPTNRTRSTAFNFGGYTLTFGLPEGGDISNATSQNYAVQTGLLLSVVVGEKSGTEDASLSLTNVKLSGTISHLAGSDNSYPSGAFVVSNIAGHENANDATKRNIIQTVFDQIELRGLKVDGVNTGTAFAPLLVNCFKTSVNVTVNNISDTYGFDKDAVGAQYAATSLFGTAGYKNGDVIATRDITMAFGKPGDGNVCLQGKLDDTANNAADDCVFTKASLFMKLIYDERSNSRFNYNFNKTPDTFTLGSELTQTPRICYYDDQETEVLSAPIAGTDYRPYVFDAAEGRLYVNVVAKASVGGFGTYEYPYIINTTSDLIGYYEIMNSSVLPLSIQMPKYVAPVMADLELTNTNFSDATKWDWTQSENYIKNSDGRLVREDPDQSRPKVTLPVETLQSWLLGAYYYIEDKVGDGLDLSGSSFTGFGTKLDPFHGVIVGAVDQNIVILPNSARGLVNVANGCAVEQLVLQYEDPEPNTVGADRFTTATLATDVAEPNTTYPYFGGVIGWVVGGDNQISKVNVSLTSLTMTDKRTIAGGYVGLISGGGVIFRGSNNAGSDVFKTSADTYSTYQYVAPYVGRVLNGYAVCDDGTTYNNWNKNAEITRINTAPTQITVTGTTYNVSTAEQLLMLSYAINSGFLATAGDTNGSYGTTDKALSRFGYYNYVNVNKYPQAANTVQQDGKYAANDQFAKATSYLGRWFASFVTENITVSLSSEVPNYIYDMSGYRNGFHGLGGMYPKSPKMNITELNGGNFTVILGMDFRQYYISEAYEPDTAVYLGLIPTSESATISVSSLTVQGTVSLMLINGDGNEINELEATGETKATGTSTDVIAVGAVVGYARTPTFTDVTIGNRVSSTYAMSVISPDISGGIIGYAYYGTAITEPEENPVLSGCSCYRIDVQGMRVVGGMIGYAGINKTGEKTKITVYFGANTVDSAFDLISEHSRVRLLAANNFSGNYSAKNLRTKGAVGQVCAGGVIGYLTGATPNNSESTIRNVKIQNSATLLFTNADTAINNTNAKCNSIHAGSAIGGGTCTATLDNITSDANICAAFTLGVAYQLAKDPDHATIDRWNSETDDEAYHFTGTEFDDVSALIKFLFGLQLTETTNYYGGSASGIMGSSYSKTTFSKCRVVSESGRTAIVSMNTAGGILANHRQNEGTDSNIRMSECTVDASPVGSIAYPIFIISENRAAGLLTYTNNQTQTRTWHFSDCSVDGYADENNNACVYVFATGTQRSTVSALVGESEETTNVNVNLNTCSASHVILGGARGGMVVGSVLKGNVICDGVTVSNCKLYIPTTDKGTNGSTYAAAGGVIGAVWTGSFYLNNVLVEDSLIQSGTNDADMTKTIGTGGVVGSVFGAVYGNAIIIKNTKLGHAGTMDTNAKTGYFPWSRAIGDTPSGAYSQQTLVDTLSTDGNNVGMVGGMYYDSTGSIQILGYNRYEDDPATAATMKFVGSALDSSTSNKVVFGGYHADTYENGENDQNIRCNLNYNNDGTLAANGHTITTTAQSYGAWQGESVGAVGTERTPNVLQGTTVSNGTDCSRVPWFSDRKVTSVNLAEKLVTLGEVTGRTDLDASLANIPLLQIEGEPDILPAYLNLITNGGYENLKASATYSVRKYEPDYSDGGTLGGEMPGGSVSDSVSVSDVGITFYGARETNESGDEVEQFDRLTGEAGDSFTKLTVTFTNQATAAVNATYSLDVLIYRPKVMQMKSTVRAVSHEEYNIADMDALRGRSSQERACDINQEGTISLMVSFAYDEERMKVLETIPKRLFVCDGNGALDNENPLPAGTKITLIDLNHNAGESTTDFVLDLAACPVYQYLIPSGPGKSEIRWSDFLPSDPPNYPGVFPYTDLKDLKTQQFPEGDAEGKGGIENYIVVIEFPEVTMPQGEDNISYWLNADGLTDGLETTIKKTPSPVTNPDFQNITIWNNPGVDVHVEGYLVDGVRQNDTISNTDGVVAKAKIRSTVTYNSRYVESLLTLYPDAARYGCLKLNLQDANSESVLLPVGTKVTVKKVAGSVETEVSNTWLSSSSKTLSIPLEDSSGNPINLLNVNAVEQTYVVELDFSGTEATTFETLFRSDSNYTLHGRLFVTEDIDHPESGLLQEAAEAPVYTVPRKPNIDLSIQVPTPMQLGVNLYDMDAEDATNTNNGRIDFHVTTNLSAVSDMVDLLQQSANGVTAKLELTLKKKGADNSYEPVTALGSYVTSLSVNGTPLTAADDGKWTVNDISGFISNSPAPYAFDCPMTLQVNTSISEYANYWLEATLTITDARQPPTITKNGSAHIIYSVVRLKNEIEDSQFIQ